MMQPARERPGTAAQKGIGHRMQTALMGWVHQLGTLEYWEALLAGFAAGLSWPWYVVWLGISVMLLVEHRLMKPQDLRHVNTAFFTLNGIISPVVLIGVLLGIYI